MIYLQVAVRSFAGNPSTLLSAYDEKREILLFQKGSGWTDKRLRDDAVLIVDSESITDRDFLFREEYLQPAVRHYHDMQSSKQLVIQNDMKRFDAGNQIQVDSIKEKGRVFAFSPTISNDHIAALATAYYVRMNNAVEEALSMSEDIAGLLMAGNAITI